MPESIRIQDLTSKRYKVLVGLGIIFIVLALIFWSLNFHSLSYYLAAVFGIGCFFGLSSSTFTTGNVISYDSYGVTLKLVGSKTFGFRFSELKDVTFTDKGLLIIIEGIDAVKLSRKRYQEESLINLYNLLKAKN
ncbi:hypothetical protein BST97_07785 [Nonlabens spongiae]|uniref:Uncharacterized protein n=1 Tax=Nonlabens spongiae TaxID=331648 RepID=A0A1W6MKB0_9FLAO|nr:hypothetical protein [Nonlabens spongiae]ARN77909.1 hypothetical protein BST97_07785 [Nonlabens spongiae]